MPLVVFRAETCRNFASYGQLLCLLKEVNNRTKTIVMSERFPEKKRRCCRCFLPDTAGNTVRSFQNGDKTDMACRAVAKKALGIPDSMSLREALLLSSNNFHGMEMHWKQRMP